METLNTKRFHALRKDYFNLIVQAACSLKPDRFCTMNCDGVADAPNIDPWTVILPLVDRLPAAQCSVAPARGCVSKQSREFRLFLTSLFINFLHCKLVSFFLCQFAWANGNGTDGLACFVSDNEQTATAAAAAACAQPRLWLCTNTFLITLTVLVFFFFLLEGVFFCACSSGCKSYTRGRKLKSTKKKKKYGSSGGSEELLTFDPCFFSLVIMKLADNLELWKKRFSFSPQAVAINVTNWLTKVFVGFF